MKNHKTKYCEKHDSYYDPELDIWLEDLCDNLNCYFCNSRPEKPSEVKE